MRLALAILAYLATITVAVAFIGARLKQASEDCGDIDADVGGTSFHQTKV